MPYGSTRLLKRGRLNSVGGYEPPGGLRTLAAAGLEIRRARVVPHDSARRGKAGLQIPPQQEGPAPAQEVLGRAGSPAAGSPIRRARAATQDLHPGVAKEKGLPCAFGTARHAVRLRSITGHRMTARDSGDSLPHQKSREILSRESGGQRRFQSSHATQSRGEAATCSATAPWASTPPAFPPAGRS